MIDEYLFPCDAGTLLAALRGRRITSVRRQVLTSDYNLLSPAIRDEESDGPTEFVMDDDNAIHFVPDTEQMSVKVRPGRMPVWGDYFHTIEPATNAFWAQRIGKPVYRVNVLVSDHAEPRNRSEFGVELKLEGGLRLVVEYVSDNEHTDALRVSGNEPIGSYRTMRICG